MPKDNPNRGADEAVRIDPQSEDDLSYWADKLNLSKDQLRGIIDQVGSWVIDIEMVIGKYTPAANPR